jgi:hypothetical protein
MTLLDEPIDLADGVYEGEALSLHLVKFPEVLVAAGFPVNPPADWFDPPTLDKVTPLVIEADGRVYGHIAGWKQDHIGMNGRIRAPHSKSNYAFFATGLIHTAEGREVNVGQISLVGGHAPLEASVAEAVAHYDNTDSAMMDVAVGEDKHGIWVAGALRPDVDELKLRKLRASGVSGDWRPINGNLELVAVCSVNVPGFPIPRARVAAGQPMALVAAGSTEVVEAMIDQFASHEANGSLTAAMSSFDERLRMVEAALLGRILERREALTSAVEMAREMVALGQVPVAESIEDLPDEEGGKGDDDEVGLPDEDEGREDDRLQALRDRVYASAWGDGMPFHLTSGECLQAALRARVRGHRPGIVARGDWNAKARKTAAKKGLAMPDGSYPIADLTDLNNAIQSLGRASDRAKTLAHIRKRARALRAPKDVMDRLAALKA